MFSAKKSFCFFLLSAVFFNACASRPRLPPEEIPAPPPLSPPPQRITPIEQAVQRVKRNGSDIEKYFLLDEDGGIIVKADTRAGIDDFEVVYNLSDTEAVESGEYRVRFSVRNIESGMSVEDSFIWRPRAGREGILLSFDDDYTDSWERCFDFFDEYGVKTTFFICGIPDPFCAKAVNRGHDIGYHSLNHLDLRKISAMEFYEETVESAQAFRRAGIPLLSFAYPYGFSQPWMHEVLFNSFAVLRGYGVTYRLYREDEIRSSYIVSRAIDNTVIRGEDNFDREITLMLRTVKFLENGMILPLTTHDISDTADWGISRRRLEFLFQTAADLLLVFYRYSDFAPFRK